MGKFSVIPLTLVVLLAGCAVHGPASPKALNPALVPPDAPREFRAVWVATVGNIDWPSRPGLSVSEQRGEMLAILDRAKSLNLNAIVFQVRTSCDALYYSPYEPWSYFLTGEQGKPPGMGYDPLRDWIAESHRRGLELHAWFNPYRARAAMEKGTPRQRGAATATTKELGDRPPPKVPYLLAPWHVANVWPDIVKTYGSYLWLDPGEKIAQDYTLAVMADVVRRYDVDGIHIDDYFYPYRENGDDGKELDFPDGPSWGRYQAGGGKLSRDDWRRDNINRLVHRMYTQTKAIKPWVKVGISPFGIWRPGHPETVKGFDAYQSIYCDSKLWWNEGWVDYLTPQLYWGLHEGTKPPYEDLLKWWASENTKGRNLWPGLYTSRIGRTWDSKMILDQIAVDRKTPGVSGEVHFSMVALSKDSGSINEALKGGPYAQPALVPASPWLGNKAPAAPKFEVKGGADGVAVSWKPAGKVPAAVWLVQARYGETWRNFIYGQWAAKAVLPESPDAVVVNAVDRLGNVSAKAEAVTVGK